MLRAYFGKVAGGDVGVESIFRQGSTFWFTVKVAIGEATTSAPTHEPLIQVTSEDLAPVRWAKILLAEDNVLNQQVAMELLAQAGFETDLAENGQIATQKVIENDYDLVLMDMQMPVMDGVTAAREIRGQFAELPILAMTANAMTQDRELCLEAGMNDHIAKPIDPNILLSKLVEWLPHREVTEVPEVESPIVSEPAVQKSNVDPLQNVDGLDINAGLRNVANNREFYERLIRQVVTGPEAQTVQTVQTLIQKEDYEAAERCAHSLKGVAGTIGAIELQAEARKLELAIQSNNDIDTSLQAVDRELTKLLASINALLPAESTSDQQPVGDEDISIDSGVLPEFIAALEEKKRVWEELSETQSINDIEAFATDIKEIAEKYTHAPLTQWAETLADQAGMFDLDNMSQTLSDFPGFIENLHS